MGLRASVTLIDQASYDAVARGDLEQMTTIDEPDRISLEKTWHAIHYLVTGKAEMIFIGGGIQLECVSEHCEVHSPGSIATLHQIVSGRTAADFISSMDVDEFNRLEIYPSPWNSGAVDYVADYLAAFLTQLDHAARMKCGFLIIIL